MNALLAAAGLLALLLATAPRSLLEYDGLLFTAAVERFQPLLQHPHAPGYPVYVALGKIVDLAVGSPFSSLVWVSIGLSLVGFVALARAFGSLVGDARLGLAGALLFYLSAGMLVYASVPLSDAAAVAFIALALAQAFRGGANGDRPALLTGVFASLAVGCRPQLAVMIVPLLALMLVQRRSARLAVLVSGSFTAVSLAWLVPLVWATGGVRGFLAYQFAQASDFAANDANLARSGWGAWALALRFIAHPWGPKALSIPVLGCALVGGAAWLRRREFRDAPLAAAGALYLLFAATTMDPVDGVRYALPATLVVALFATRGASVLARFAGRLGGWAVIAAMAAFAVGSVGYVAPVVFQRHRTVSPPAQAAAWARDHLPPDAVILFDRSMQPHAQELFGRFTLFPLGPDYGATDEGGDRPVYVLADGASDLPDAVTFTWPDSDAYGKLTRNHYRVVSLVPMPRTRRFRAVHGVYRPERTVEGRLWRWLAPSATIALPDLGCRTVEIDLAVPKNYPWDSVGVTIEEPGRPAATAVVSRNRIASVTLDLSPGPTRLEIDSNRAFVPANVPAMRQRDERTLGVMLLGVEQRK